MYEALTLNELNTLQSMLYEGTQIARDVAEDESADADCFRRYAQVHAEVGRMFIDAGTELVGRIDALQAVAA